LVDESKPDVELLAREKKFTEPEFTAN
jgi:hypothetical protein